MDCDSAFATIPEGVVGGPEGQAEPDAARPLAEAADAELHDAVRPAVIGVPLADRQVHVRQRRAGDDVTAIQLGDVVVVMPPLAIDNFPAGIRCSERLHSTHDSFESPF